MQRLKKTFREATQVEKPALTEFRDKLRERIKILRRAECHGRDRKRWTSPRTFKYLSKLLGDKISGELKATKEQVEEHLHQVHSDHRREDSLKEMEKLIKPAEPTIHFSAEEPSWQEVNNFLKKAGQSAPGPNGIPYKMYKLRRRHWKLLRVAWRKNFLADGWLVAEGCFIPKEENSTEIKQFQTISLLNVEGKIFFGILLWRLTTFMLDNDYMYTSDQKGGVPGCLEHTSVISKIIEDV
ncbi:hypothetical protein N1851_003779 [Merluccius polli]|uniref:Uncharacterized protein n=1 Tax=Merluccius polli TaxID=89951 RepID=A0AA47N9I6_MERPO|nr:hypothetical protein N1851_003779 [Merluccius polli]